MRACRLAPSPGLVRRTEPPLWLLVNFDAALLYSPAPGNCGRDRDMIRIRIKKRRPGDRAGLTRMSIALAAAKQIEKGGEDPFNFRELARSLGVAPTTISSHFKGGLADLEDEVVRTVLADVAPPFRPMQTPVDYLERMFLAALTVLQGRPTLAMLAILRMTRNPFVVPEFAEQSLVSLEAMGVAPTVIGAAYREILHTFFGLILAGPGRAYLVPKTEALIAALTPSTLTPRDYPQLFAFQELILADLSEALSWTPDLDKVQASVADLAEVLATLSDEAPNQTQLLED